ncbi:CP family cyanate transporter-like MFS transporter OS=Streptomyces violarus OX=67380 GN=FHS41_008186 PE=4 SV=1 [Streptomyces violarus]
MWAALAAAAVLPWLPVLRDRSAGEAGQDGPGAAAQGETQAPALRITRSRTAWALAVFFGLQATAAYITMGWMAQIFRDDGVPAGTAAPGRHDGDGRAAGLRHPAPGHPAAPPGTHRTRAGVCGLIGYAGLYAAPAEGAWAWALLLGVSNCAFPLALTMVGMRARSGPGVAQLSAFAQSTGYLISIPARSWWACSTSTAAAGTASTSMVALMVPQMAVGWLAGRDRTVEEEAAAR